MSYCVLPLSLLTAAVCFSQEPIRVNVNLVNVSFSIAGFARAFVGDLTKDDFEVVEDAIPQKIAFFSRSSDVPLTLGLIADASGSQDHFSKQHKHDLEQSRPATISSNTALRPVELSPARRNGP